MNAFRELITVRNDVRLADDDFIKLLENNLANKKDRIATASDEVKRLEGLIAEAETNLKNKVNDETNGNENDVVCSNQPTTQHKRRFLKKKNIELSSDDESEVDCNLLLSNTINTSLGDDVIDNHERKNKDWDGDDVESSDSDDI